MCQIAGREIADGEGDLDSCSRSTRWLDLEHVRAKAFPHLVRFVLKANIWVTYGLSYGYRLCGLAKRGTCNLKCSNYLFQAACISFTRAGKSVQMPNAPVIRFMNCSSGSSAPTSSGAHIIPTAEAGCP